MKIVSWSIDGFGVFRDHAGPELPDGITVLHGPNEAGKSTLLAFIRGVLFGFKATERDCLRGADGRAPRRAPGASE